MLLVNLAGRFLLELAAIGSVGYWGFQVGGATPIRILVAAGAIALLVLVWAFVIAPNADNRLDPDIRVVIGSAVLLLASGALAAAGQPTLALVFGAAVIVNTVLLFALRHDIPGTLSRSA
jgi:Protein of unknown function (DUF2568)